MMRNKKLLKRGKRFLALLLAVAMTFGDLPAIAYAQEPAAIEEAAVDETLDEEALAVETAEAESLDAEATVDESATEELGADESEVVTVDESIVAQEGEGESSSASESSSSTPTEPEGSQLVKRLETVISVSEGDLIGSLRTDGYEYATDTHTVVVKYVEDAEKDLTTYPPVKVSNTVKNWVNVRVDNVTYPALKDSLDYTWQKWDKETGKYVPMENGDLPHAVGKYQWVAAIADQVGVCAKAEAVVLNLEIVSAVLDVKADTSKITPGWTVERVLAEYAQSGFELDVNGTQKTADQDRYADKVELKVVEAYDATETALDGKTVLQRNQDYRLIFAVTLKGNAKDNFVVGKNNFLIHFTGPVKTEMEVIYKSSGTETPNKEIVKVYDGTPVDVDALVKPEYTARVIFGKTKNPVSGMFDAYELEGAEINETWCNADKVAYAADFVPVDAGVYYYMLSYSDETGTYIACENYIKVEIRMATIVIEPKMDSANVFAGQKVSDILKKVFYNVYKVDANGTKATSPDNIGPYYWGVAYDQGNDKNEGRPSDGGNAYTQSYEPLFAIQRAIKQADPADAKKFITVGWETLNPDTTLEMSHEEAVLGSDGKQETVILPNEYRVVFSGKKVVYNADGSIWLNKTVDINASQKNYGVDWTDAAIDKYGLAVPLILTDAKEVTIDVSAILDGENGKNFDNPIVKTYSGEDLYKTKDLYKKAVVKSSAETVAQNADKRLTYTWQEVDTGNIKEKEKVNGVVPGYYVEEDSWYVPDNFNDVEKQSSPRNAGVYRLEIKFTDPTNEYRETTQYVYYTIKPQDIIAVLKGAENEDGTTALPAIFADGKNTGTSIVEMIQNTDSENKETYVNLALYQAIVTEDAAGNVTVKPDLEKPLNLYTANYFFKDNEAHNTYRHKYFYVEKLVKEGVNAGKWIPSTSDILKKDESYRLNIKNLNYYYYDDSSSSYNGNYNFGKKLNKYNLPEKDKDNNVIVYYENEALEVTMKDTQGIELEIFVDEDLIQGNEKIYDGKPFDITNLKNIVSVRKKKDGADVTKDVVDKGLLKYTFAPVHDSICDGYYDNAYQYINKLDIKDAIHANTYTLTISLETNENYQGTDKTINKKFKIDPKEVTIKPILVETINAGKIRKNTEYVNDGWQRILSGYNNHSHFAVDATQIIAGDEGLISAIDTVKYNVKDATGTVYYDSTTNKALRSSKTYYVEAASSPVSLKTKPVDAVIYKYSDKTWREWRRISYYDMDYSFKHESVSFTPVRVASTVESYGNANQKTVLNPTVEAKDGSFVHTIKVSEGVPYFYNDAFAIKDKDGENKTLTEGNYILFRVNRPEEFDDDPKGFDANYALSDYVYANSIEQAGGYFVSGGIDAKGSFIALAFKASDFDASENPSFDIMWEKDYVETYVVDLKQMQAYLEADLRKAVSPKSLSFNGVSKKMAVGETQQLDVKIAKTQMSDIICLGYKSDNEEVLKVTDTGLVTAISTLGKKNATATITVFPCRKVGDVKVPITDKGTKTAKVKITVSNVAAPKLSKVKAYDTYADFTYTLPANGYRREIYVMEGKKKAQDFEAVIANVKNGDYSAFAYKRLDINEGVCLTDAKKNIISVSCGDLNESAYYNVPCGGLIPNTNYTVYVRNVSGLRVLEDGTQIATSAAGNVKSFKTSLSQIKELKVYFDYDAPKQTVNRETRYAQTMNVANLKDKSATVSVDAKLYEFFSKGYSDTGYPRGEDYIWRTMPMAKDLKKYYYTPKINYYVCEDEPKKVGVGPGTNIYATKELAEAAAKATWGAGKYICLKDWHDSSTGITYTKAYFSKNASIAKVDKKGKITFKGKGYLYVIAQDSVTELYAVERLLIDAEPTSMTAKKAKLVPGQEIDLSSLLEYKEGKTKIVGYAKPHYNTYKNRTEYFINLSTAEATAEDYTIRPYDHTGFLNVEDAKDYKIKAVKAGGKRNVEIKDSAVAANGGKTAIAKINTAIVQPVKKLKASRVVDEGFIFTFQYPERTFQFVLELKDARGNVIRNEIRTLSGIRDTKSKKANYIFTYGFADNTSKYDAVLKATHHGLYDWSDPVWGGKPFQYSEVELTANSKYSLTVTAICEGQSSKIAKMNVKTTNVPFSYCDLTNYIGTGGESISVSTLATGANAAQTTLQSKPILRTGNTYTLSLDAKDDTKSSFNNVDVAGKRVTDTLKWKSSNTKVATIKAKSSTSASLKAVKQGETVIEVTSKITKKVIARWTVVVGAAGDAGSYFGDNEPYRNEDGTIMFPLDSEALQITAGNKIQTRIKKNEEKWLLFTAPADGEYTITTDRGNIILRERDKGGTTIASGTSKELKKNAKVYCYINNTNGTDDIWATVEVSGTLYKKAYIGEKNKVKLNDTITFTAPETNYYTFKVIDETEKDDALKVKQTYSIGIALGGTELFVVGDDNYTNSGDLDGAILLGREYSLEITKREMQAENALEIDKAKEVSLTAAQTKPEESINYPNDISPNYDSKKVVSEEKWYYFTADQTNSFTFTFTDVQDGTLVVTKYDSLSDETGTLVTLEDLDDHTTNNKGEVRGELSVKVGDSYTPSTTPAPAKGNAKTTEIPLIKGNTVYFKLTCKAGDPACAEVEKDENGKHKDEHKGTPVTGKMTVTRHLFAKDLTEGKKEEVSIAKNSFGQSIPVWYSFTANETGYYTVSTVGATKLILANRYINLKGDIDPNYTGALGHYTKTDKANNLRQEYKLVKGTTIFLKVDSNLGTVTDPVTASIVVEKRKPKDVLEVGKAVDIALDQDDVLWYEFDANEFNMYTFSTTGADNPENKENRSSGTINVEFVKDITADDSDVSNKLFVGKATYTPADNYCNFVAKDCEMASREKIYLKLTLGTTPVDPVQAKLTVTKRGAFSDLPIGTAKSFSVKNGVDQWFKIVADEKNYYEVCLTGGKDSKGAVNVELYKSLGGNPVQVGTDLSNNPITKYSVDKDEYECFTEAQVGGKLEKGTVRYLHLSTGADTSNDRSADVTVLVRKRKLVEKPDLDTKDAGTVVKLNDHEVQWYRFTSTDDNFYTFEGSGISNGTVTATVYDELIGDKTSGSGINNFKISNVEIVSGKTIYVRFDATASDASKQVEVTVKVKKQRPVGDKNISADGVGVELKAGEEIWYPFVADEKNCYTFYSENVEGGSVTAEYYTALNGASRDKDLGSSDGKLLNKDGTEIYIPNNGKTVYLRIAAPTANAKLTLKVKKRVLSGTKLTLDDKGVEVKLKKGEEAWYAFTSDMDNMYTFYADDLEKGDLAIYYFDGCIDHNSDSYMGAHFDGTYGFNQQLEVTDTTNDQDAVSHTASEGKRSVKIADRSIKKDQTVYVRVKGVDPDDKKDTTEVTMMLKVKRRDIGKDDLLDVGDAGAKKVELDAKSEKWLKFVAPEENIYTFYSNDVTDGTITVGYVTALDANFPSSSDFNNYKSTSDTFEIKNKRLQKGQIVYIGLKDAVPAAQKTKVTATIRVKKVDAKKLVVGSVDSTELTGSDQWYIFEPTEDDSYVFNVEEADDKTDIIWLYARKEFNGNESYIGGGSGKFETNYKYYKTGEKIYLRVECNSTITATNKVTVKLSVKKRADAENTITLGNGEKKSLTMSSMNSDYKWYAIKATENGYYKITATSEYQTGLEKTREITFYDKNYLEWDENHSYPRRWDTYTAHTGDETELEEDGGVKKYKRDYTYNTFVAKGDTLYIRVKVDMLEVTDPKEAVETKFEIERVSEVVRTAIQGTNGVEKFAFTAPEKGPYYFFTMGTPATYGFVMRNGVVVATGEGNSSRNNSNRRDCWMKCNLNKGDTVEFNVKGESYTPDGGKTYVTKAFTTELHVSTVSYRYYNN